jgi:hypothetical protein
VNTHNVTRSSGRSFLSPRPSYTSRSYTPSPAPPRVPTSTSVGWINPNARCPVCGAAVFFYANRNGGRVFFDDLGPPWPKHPCTDNGMAQPADCRAPSRRDFNAVRSPSDLRDRRWKSYAVREVVVEKDHSRIVLQPLNGSGAGPTWTVAGQVPLRVDDLVFTRARQMSYFDTAVGEPVVVEDAKRRAGASQVTRLPATVDTATRAAAVPTQPVESAGWVRDHAGVGLRPGGDVERRLQVLGVRYRCGLTLPT